MHRQAANTAIMMDVTLTLSVDTSLISMAKAITERMMIISLVVLFPSLLIV